MQFNKFCIIRALSIGIFLGMLKIGKPCKDHLVPFHFIMCMVKRNSIHTSKHALVILCTYGIPVVVKTLKKLFFGFFLAKQYSDELAFMNDFWKKI